MQDTQGISRGQLCYCLAACNRDTFTMRKLSCNELKLQNDSSRENFLQVISRDEKVLQIWDISPKGGGPKKSGQCNLAIFKFAFDWNDEQMVYPLNL